MRRATATEEHGVLRPSTAGTAHLVFEHHAGPYSLGASFASCDEYQSVFVADEEGLLGQLHDGTTFSADVPPGRHEIVVWLSRRLSFGPTECWAAPSLSAVRVDLAPDQTYVLEVAHTGGIPKGLRLEVRDRAASDLAPLIVDGSKMRDLGSPDWLACRLAQGHERALSADVLGLRPTR
jgi:hypothetical protein